MPRIFDNIDTPILDALKETLQSANRADFCVGYFNLRGWRLIDEPIAQFAGGEGACCRVLAGMQRLPKDELRRALAIGVDNKRVDNSEAIRLKKLMAQEFREQLTVGAPTNADEAGLQRLKQQLLDKKLVVKLFLRHPLHAKLYLIHLPGQVVSLMGFLGSSNLTFSGLGHQGELNVDVTDFDATKKLQQWFEDRWQDKFCMDISKELATLIEESWVKERSPYHIYLKMAYHLSQEARDGLSQYQAPRDFGLLPFQEAAVRIAARHVNQRGGVAIGDVVGLGKTLVGTAIAHICEEEYGISTLIICPKNLVPMWQSYVERYGLRGKVMSVSQVVKELPHVPARFRLVLIDESHNLRNREGKRYAAIKEYIEQSGSRCILLTATPYNKTYLDLSAQLRLFVPEDRDLGMKPEAYIRELGNEAEFRRKYPQTPVRSLAAFERSEHSEDWQQLMSRYMVRRTRSFIKNTYAKKDPEGDRFYLEFPDGSRSYFPVRCPKTVPFTIGEPEVDPYARLYSEAVVEAINALQLPRYGLGNYELPRHRQPPTPGEQKILDGLSRAGRRLMGFCRTNLFKRLESSGEAFLQSLKRHVLRNYIYLHAIAHDLEIPIGTQNAEFLDTANSDEDADSVKAFALDLETQEEGEDLADAELEEVAGSDRSGKNRSGINHQIAEYQQRAADIYDLYVSQYRRRFKWLRPSLFRKELKRDLQSDAQLLLEILERCGTWEPEQDSKLAALIELLQNQHQGDKVLIFTQFADTARYLGRAIAAQGIQQAATVTGQSQNPTAIAWQFSPNSNQKWDRVPPEEELRVLVSTDVLSEGQNLQDCFAIVNYDLPWAIIRLIQRAGRVDRIGQKADEILCYSFLPADGVEQLINLRGRLRDRLQANAEVVGTDEAFFEDETQRQVLLDLYHEKSTVLEEEDDGEVDLTSEALQIWQSAIEANPKLQRIIEDMPNVVHSTRHHDPDPIDRPGVLVYLRTADGMDALAWIDEDGNSVTQSQMRILRMARCNLDTPALPRHPKHHDLVETGANLIAQQDYRGGGQLGTRRSAAARTYDRLKQYIQKTEEERPLLAVGQTWETLKKAVEDIYQYPLRQPAIAKLNRELKQGISDEQLAHLVVLLREQDALCVVHLEDDRREAQILCSLGLFPTS